MKKSIIGDADGVHYVECNEDRAGRFHGKATWWTLDADNAPARKWRTCRYNHGELDGVLYEYYEDGVTLREERTYMDDTVNGYYARYDPDGSLYIECMFKRGKLEGDFKVWQDVGRSILLEKSTCKNDLPVYKCMYNEAGQITREFYYNTDGVCTEEIEYIRETSQSIITRKQKHYH